MAYTRGGEELRAQVLEVTAKSYETGAAWLRAAADDNELPMPPESLACSIHALIEELLIQRLLAPELVPDDTIHAAFAALAAK